MLTRILLIAFIVVAAFAEDAPETAMEGIIDLKSATFADYVGKDHGLLVEFYAPWCGHCKHLAPEYAKLGAAIKASGTKKIVAAKVNAEAESELASKYGVTGYPTLKYFPANSDKAEDYSGGREAPDLVKFINEKTQAGLFIPHPVSYVTVLDHTNFDNIALDATKNVLVKFYAPWCGHCKHLAPVYEKVAETYQGEKDLVIAEVNADEASNKGLAQKYGVSGFPTLKWFPKANKEGEEYNGGREAEDFIKFFSEKVGSKRVLGGALAEDAGTDAELNTLAAEYVTAVTGERAAVKARMVTRAAAVAESGALYLKVVASIEKKGDEYVTKEAERITKMLDGKLTVAKRDELQIRRNILRKFKKA